MENMNICEASEIPMDTVMNGIERIINSSVDVSKETEKIISLVPENGYQKKIELIMQAQDMSTSEKIKAIDAAEDKRMDDLNNASNLCKDIMWTKTGTVIACAAAVVLFTSPEGRKIATNILKRVA